MLSEVIDSHGPRPLSSSIAKPKLVEIMDMGDMVHSEMPEQLLQHSEVAATREFQSNERVQPW